MISLFIAALFGSNSRNLDRNETSNQQLFGYEQPQPSTSSYQNHQYAVNNYHPHQQQVIQPSSITNGQLPHVSVINQQPQHPPPCTSTDTHYYNPYNHQQVPNNQNVKMAFTSPPSVIPQQSTNIKNPNVHSPSAILYNQQPIETDLKPSAPSGSLLNTYPIPSTSSTLNESINFHFQTSQQDDVQPPPPPSQTSTPHTTTTTIIGTEQNMETFSVAGMPITIQKPVVATQPIGRPPLSAVDQQPPPVVTLSMNASMTENSFGIIPSSNVDITKPFVPLSKTQVITNTQYGQSLCYQQGFNNGIRVNQRVIQTGDPWTSEHEYGTYNVCFRISPLSGEHNPFSGLVLGFTGIANQKPPPGHTHFIVFNNVLQRIEKRAYPNDCRPSIAGARYMLLESVIIPYNFIASFEVDCVGGRVNKQSLSCVICMLTNGQSVRINFDEMDSITMSTEKAQFMYQALNYSLAMLKHKKQTA